MNPVHYLGYAIIAILALVWLYIAARLISRAVMRTLNERKR